MNYGEVGRRRRVLLAGVGSELEAALAPRGFTSGLLPWVLGEVCPSLPTTAAIRACWRSLWCKSIPVWGSLCSPAEQVGACRVNGAVLARGWMQDGCSAASLEVCEGGTAASLGTWRGEARNGALPCFPLMPGWVLVLGAGLTQHPRLSSASPSPEPVLLLSCPFCPAPCPCPASQVLLPPCSSMAGWEKRGGCLPRHPWLPRSLMCKDFPLIVLWVQRECVLPGSHS